MKINYKIVLVIIFLLTLAFRLYISFTNTSFSSDDSYFNLRVTNYIIDNKRPLIYDDLSYSGRTLVYPQAFNVFLAVFSFIPSYEKIIPALLISSIVFIVYLISKKISNNVKVSLFMALTAAFIPIEIKTNVNQISVYSLVIPIILLMILALLNLDQKRYFNLFVILSFLLPLIHPISFLFAFSLLFYLILINTESINIDKSKKEAVAFSFFIILVINFFLYKSALIKYGTNIIWQSIPQNLFSVYFQTFNIIEILYLLGFIPLILGIIGIYSGIFRKKEESMILLGSFLLATLILVSLKLINLQIALLFISLPLLIASSKSLKDIYDYFTITKFDKLERYFDITLLVLIVIASIIPAIIIGLNLPNYNQEINTFSWVRENSNKDSIILAPFEFGNILTYISERKNVLDDNFLLAPNSNERIEDIGIIYKTPFEVKGLELIKKYNINYIYIPSNLTIPYINDEKCFEMVNQDVQKVKC